MPIIFLVGMFALDTKQDFINLLDTPRLGPISVALSVPLASQRRDEHELIFWNSG